MELYLGLGMAVLGMALPGLAIAMATGKAVDAAARQPEASGKIMTILILGCALAEATAIYGFVVALLMLFR